VKKLVYLGLAGAVGLGGAAAALVLLLTRYPDAAPEEAGAAPAPAPAPAPDAVAAPLPVTPPLAVPGPQGPRYLGLPPDVVERDLMAVLPPCHRVNAMGPGPPALLTLELEARDAAGLVVVDARVASPGGASEGLLSCARQALLGRRVAAGSFQPGETYLVQLQVRPGSQAASPPPEPPSTSQSIGRPQRPRRGGSP
jgi:hypothetical protein